MKQLSSLILFLSVLGSATAVAEPICILTGRQHYQSLTEKLGLSDETYKPRFDELRNNLPKNGNMSEFANSLASLWQLADPICTDFAREQSPEEFPAELSDTQKRMFYARIFRDVFGGGEQTNLFDPFGYYYNADASVSAMSRYCRQALGELLYQWQFDETAVRQGFPDRPKFDDQRDPEVQAYCDRVAAEVSRAFQPEVPPYNVLPEVQAVYGRLLGRRASTTEVGAIGQLGLKKKSDVIYVSCVQIAVSPDFIMNGQCEAESGQ